MPNRRWEVYLLPHSHVDIGYTALQTEIEPKHWEYFEQAIELSKKTAHLPRGSRFKWNVEVLWAVDSYLKQATPEKKRAFIDAVKRGWIGLDGLYSHQLGGLCRDEELVRLTDFARQMRQEYGVEIDAAMATDIAGYTWGIVPVMAKSGIKYLSMGPNNSHRIGYTRLAWDNRPFYWQSPCGTCRVLCWQCGNSYHPAFKSGPGFAKFLCEFEREHPEYPYEMIYFRQCRGDNGPPDEKLCEWVSKWNSSHEYPKADYRNHQRTVQTLRRALTAKEFLPPVATSHPIGKTVPHPRPSRRPSIAQPPSDCPRPRFSGAHYTPPIIRPTVSARHGETFCSTTNTPGARKATHSGVVTPPGKQGIQGAVGHQTRLRPRRR